MLSVDNVSYAFGKKQALQALSLSAEPGEIHGILGPNGAGKTTLFRIISGWLKPQSGAVRLDGAPAHIRKTAFLETENYFYPYVKGIEHLRLIKDDLPAIEQWNRLFQLPLERIAEDYSTGMKKKLAFIGVMLQERPLLILDEPFNGVDLESNELMMAVIRKAASKRVTLVSSHILHTLTRVCDRISVMQGGQIEKTYEAAEFHSLERIVKEKVDREMEQAAGYL